MRRRLHWTVAAMLAVLVGTAPAATAKKFQVVALGDSLASGEGAPTVDGDYGDYGDYGVTVAPRQCRTSFCSSSSSR